MRPTVRCRLTVAALFVVTCGISIPLAAYGVFPPALAEALGWSRGAISTALSINLVLGGVAGLGIGALADRHGPRVLLAPTVALATAPPSPRPSPSPREREASRFPRPGRGEGR